MRQSVLLGEIDEANAAETDHRATTSKGRCRALALCGRCRDREWNFIIAVVSCAKMSLARKNSARPSFSNEINPNKTKDFDLRQQDSVVYQRSREGAE